MDLAIESTSFPSCSRMNVVFAQPLKSLRSLNLIGASLLLSCVALNGCRATGYAGNQSAPPHSSHGISTLSSPIMTVSAISDIDEAANASPQSLESFLQQGLAKNPEIHEARLRVEALACRVPQVASLPDPMLQATVFPAPVQTAAGEQEFGLSMSQQVPWQGKRSARASVAAEEVNAARAQLTAVELKVAEQIKQAYFQLYFLQQAIALIESDKQRLDAIENIVDQMYRVKREVTQQDVLQVQVQRSQIETELANYQQRKASAQARLVRLACLPSNTTPIAKAPLASDKITQDVQHYYELAIQTRPELQAQLATIERNRKATCLAQLDHLPDLTLGFNWIATSSDGISPVANGDDSLMLTMGMNLPHLQSSEFKRG